MDTREQTYSAIVKLLSSLDDPFTRFLPPDRLAALRRGTAGERPVPWRRCDMQHGAYTSWADAKINHTPLEQDLLPVLALKSPIPNQALGT